MLGRQVLVVCDFFMVSVRTDLAFYGGLGDKVGQFHVFEEGPLDHAAAPFAGIFFPENGAYFYQLELDGPEPSIKTSPFEAIPHGASITPSFYRNLARGLQDLEDVLHNVVEEFSHDVPQLTINVAEQGL